MSSVLQYGRLKYCCLRCSRSQWEKWECANCHVHMFALFTSVEEILTVLQNTLQIAMPPHLAKDVWNQMLPMPFRDYSLNPLSSKEFVLQFTRINTDLPLFFTPDIVPTASATFSHESGRGFIRSFILPESRYTLQNSIPRHRSIHSCIFTGAKSITSKQAIPMADKRRMRFFLNIRNRRPQGNFNSVAGL